MALLESESSTVYLYARFCIFMHTDCSQINGGTGWGKMAVEMKNTSPVFSSLAAFFAFALAFPLLGFQVSLLCLILRRTALPILLAGFVGCFRPIDLPFSDDVDLHLGYSL